MRRLCLVGKEREREKRVQGEERERKKERRTDPMKQTVQADLFILIFISIQFSEISVIYYI